ncbi:hypothetical protein E4K72_22275 [Oxalobacteraceae bacterium OM1]|nr:hypothetical protein E4K72_22275 [Oxalobacteraceae bacterium OM1]
MVYNFARDGYSTARVLANLVRMSAYDQLAIVLLPFSIAFALCSLPPQWRGRRRSEGEERRYWTFAFIGHALVAAGLLGSSLCMLDELLGEPLVMAAWWPSPARHFGWTIWGDDAALVDLLITLVVGLVVVGVSMCLGSVDEDGTWQPPARRLRRKPADDGGAP